MTQDSLKPAEIFSSSLDPGLLLRLKFLPSWVECVYPHQVILTVFNFFDKDSHVFAIYSGLN